MIKLGYKASAEQFAPGKLLGFSCLAEEVGFESVFISDHFQPWKHVDGHAPFSLTWLGALGARTSRVVMGTSVLTPTFRYHPSIVAQAFGTMGAMFPGRVVLGIGVGWNEMEFVGLNENFHNRGKRSEEQVQVMKALWADPYVTFEGKWHRLQDAGINPLPPSRKIPLWFGGHMDVTLQRIAKWGDGWMMLSEPPGPKAVAEFDKLRRLVEAERRDPASVGLEVWTSTGTGTEKDWREEISFWKKAGVTHVTLHNTFGGYHHKRMAGRSMTDHVGAMRRYRNAVADLL